MSDVTNTVVAPTAPASSEPGKQAPQPNRSANPGPAAKLGNSQPPVAANGVPPAKANDGGVQGEPAKARSLDELRKASENGKAQYSPDEKKRVQIAARFGLKDDAEIDAKLAELEGQKSGGKKPAPSPKPKAVAPKAGKSPNDSSKASLGIPDPDPVGDGAGGEGGTGDEIDPNADDGKQGGDEHDDADDPVKILGIKNPEDKKAVGDAVRFHKQRSDQFGSLVNGLKERGVEGSKHLYDSLDALANVDTTVKSLLSKGSAGVAELYRIMQVEMPQGFLQGQGGAGAGVGQMQSGMQQGPGQQQGQGQGFGNGFGQQGQGQGRQPSMDFGQAFTQVEDEAVVDGRFVKTMLPQLLQQSIGSVVKQMLAESVGPLNQRFEAMIPKIDTIAQQTMRSNNLNEAFRNVRTAMSAIEQINPGYKLQDSIENIWHESVLDDGNVVQDPHPEWLKLASILQEAREAKRQGYKDLRSCLADRLLKRGKLGEHVNREVAKGKVDAARERQRRLQPGLLEGRKPALEAGFKMPTTQEEARQLKETNPEGYAIYKKRLATGQF